LVESFAQAISFPKKANVLNQSGLELPAQQNRVQIKKINNEVTYVLADIDVSDTAKISSIDLSVSYGVPDSIELKRLKENFHWLPNVTNGPGQVSSQHVFRSPCMLHVFNHTSIALVPDIELIPTNNAAPYYLDLQYGVHGIKFHYGVANYEVIPHQYYAKSAVPFILKRKMQVGFYLLQIPSADPGELLAKTNSFLWSTFAKKYTTSMLPQTVRFERYAEVGYDMALQHFWVDAGKEKGGITLSTFREPATGDYRGRDAKNDLWFQSWFNNVRTAYGLCQWGVRLHHADWKQKALQTVNLLLSAPENKGWFATVYNSEKNSWIASSQQAGNVYHMPDNAWTAYWLLRFNDEQQKIIGSDTLLIHFSKALLASQNADGSFPAMVDEVNLDASPVLNHSASSAMATWYLEELLLRKKIYDSSSKKILLQSIRNSLVFLRDSILPHQRFEDFESFFSCSSKPMLYYDSNTNMFSQNTMSMQWCAEAFLKGYVLFGDKSYLSKGEYCLGILSLYQQVWNPPFISLYAFGGFGAQNSDAEWNDARQAQFADTYLQYYQATGKKEWIERAIYSCRASFALMVLAENKNVSPSNYTGTSTNGEVWPGSMAENYGHSGYDQRSYQSGFHWGTGSALTTAAILKKELGDLYVDVDNRIAEGVNGVAVTAADWKTNPTVTTRRIDKNARIAVRSHKGSKKKFVVDGQRF